MKLWRIATDTPDVTADDMTGAGARIFGARWNRRGNVMLYFSANIALAALESFVHIRADVLPLNRYLVETDVPDEVWKRAEDMRHPPVGWQAIPPGAVSLDIGDHWIEANTSALMLVPSAIVPEECNVLINPMHPDAKKLRARKLRQWTYDARLRK